MVGRVPPSVAKATIAPEITGPERIEASVATAVSAFEVLSPPDAPRTEAADRARVCPGAALPPRVRAAVDHTALGDILDRVAGGGVMLGAEVADLRFTLEGKALTRGDMIQLRKHVLAQLPSDHTHLNKTEAARNGRPGIGDLLQLLMPAGEPRPVVASLEAAQRALAKLDRAHARALNKGDAAQVASLQSAMGVQRAVVEAYEKWPTARFGPEITRFRAEGAAVDPDQAGALLYGLQRLDASPGELAALRDALLDGRDSAAWPASAKVEPPTVDSLFALMSGIEAAPTVAGLDQQIEAAHDAGDKGLELALKASLQSLVESPSRILEAPIAAFASGEGVAPGYAAVLAHSLERMELEPAQLEHLQATLLDAIPAKTRRPRSEIAAEVRRADTPEALVRVFTGEVLGKAPLPLDRKALTKLVSKTQGARGAATQARLKVLDGRRPEQLPPEQRARLDRIDGAIHRAGQRLDDLKAARAGVNAVRGARWLDRLEVDVLAGGAVGVPGIFSGSMMGGVSVNEADPTTGAREKGMAGYVMPAFSVGGYGKLDVSYDRANGVGVSGGGGADFLGIWGGPGGKSWGNIFAGGIWVPQVVNVGAGYGIEDGEPYGALILSTFWPPFSTAAGRVDTVVRHPGLALGAERGAEFVRKLSESGFVKGGRAAISAAAGWLGDALRPVVAPVRRGAAEMIENRKVRRAAEGLESEADVARFGAAMSALSGPSEAAIEAAGGDPARLAALHQAEVRAQLQQLEALAETNPDHVPTFGLLAAAATVLGDAGAAVTHAARGVDAARAHTDPKVLQGAQDNFIETALLHGDHGAAWPVLSEALGRSDALKPRLQLVRWLDGQGREQEAKQVAEGLLHEHPRAFEAQNALAGITRRPAEAQVQT